LARDRAQMESAKVALRSAEIASRQSREHLNILMGAWGVDTEWTMDRRMPDIPAQPLDVEGVERVALARSLDLSQARQRIVAAGQQVGFGRAAALVPDMDIGAGAEREGEEPWKVGPSIAVPIPLVDQGQARIRRAVA